MDEHGESFMENGRRVTSWRWEARTVHGGYRVAKVRWVYDARPGVEAWDEEIAGYEHEAPFESKLQADGVAATFNRIAEDGRDDHG